MEESVHPLVAAALAVVAYGVEPADFQQHTDRELLGVQQAAAVLQRQLDLVKTCSAGQVAHRSRRELGHAGLAAREGYRSPAELLQTVTGATAREANQLVTLGTIAGETEATQELLDSGTTEIGGEPVVVPWEAPIVQALRQGSLSADQAEHYGAAWVLLRRRLPRNNSERQCKSCWRSRGIWPRIACSGRPGRYESYWIRRVSRYGRPN